ncbi:MAG: hypothetical protein ABIO43_00510 [Sphingomicrobium sp.]
MYELATDNSAILVVGVLLMAIVAYLLLRPRQRVRLSGNVPLRPHMTGKADQPRGGNGLATEAAVVAANFTGQLSDAQLGSDVADDFERMKGVGPKFAQMLQARGFFRFDQIASLTPEEVDRLDPHLGAFRGRILRDRLVEQAQYLARGDQDGFEKSFGRL